jgi:prepilin-type N-terminal cleavage/methylation domain-containing protein
MFDMYKKEEGFTLIESLVVLVVIGILFFFLIDALNIDALQNKAKNAALQSTLAKIALSVNGFINAYTRVPNETEFLESLTSRSDEFKERCTILGLENYECIFRPPSRQLPNSCDLSGWRSDKDDTKPCYMRYYGGSALYSNGIDKSNYRLYTKMFGKDNAFYVYDSTSSGLLYKCPSTISDFDDLEECYEI